MEILRIYSCRKHGGRGKKGQKRGNFVAHDDAADGVGGAGLQRGGWWGRRLRTGASAEGGGDRPLAHDDDAWAVLWLLWSWRLDATDRCGQGDLSHHGGDCRGPWLLCPHLPRRAGQRAGTAAAVAAASWLWLRWWCRWKLWKRP